MKLKVKDLFFSYSNRNVLKNVSFELNESEMLAIVGPNGSGKSTLIKCINRVLQPKQGTILLEEKDIVNLSLMQVAKRIGYVSQANAVHIFPITVFDMVLLGRRPHLSWRSSEKDLEKVEEVLQLLKLEDYALRDMHELSGGEQQKVLIARALAQEVDILLLDEPTSNLDIKHQLEVMEIIRTLIVQRGLSVIMAIHDLNLASRYADYIVMLKDGKVHCVGEPTAVFTAGNIQSVYGIDVTVRNESGKPFVIPIKPINQI